MRFLLTLFVLGAVCTAAAQQPPDPIPAQTADDLARGKRLFEGHCAACHGMKATGGKGPNLAQPALTRAADNPALFSVIKEGIEGTAMPGAWQMTDREIWQVAGYIRSLGRVPAVSLPGDAARGKAIYGGKGCAACHIVRGQGTAYGPELTNIGLRRNAEYLREALLIPEAAVPEGFVMVRAVTRDGREVRGVRLNEDSFTIQFRDAAGSFYSFRKAQLKALDKEFGKSPMPAYKETLSNSELDDLVAYLASLRGER